jgi:hypothetical protein
MTSHLRFIVFIIVSLLVFILLLRFVLRKRQQAPSSPRIYAVAFAVVVLGMMFAKYGNLGGLPWTIYYTVPALLTLLLPPIVFHFNRDELWRYLVLAFLSSPVIHIIFSFFFGWHEYLPFIYIPSLWSLL